MIKYTLFLLLFVVSISMYSQKKSMHNYKYIVVKKQFSFLKSKDQHQTSSLVKFLFDKNGFIAVLSDEKFPEELFENKCMALYAEVKGSTSFFTTKNTIELKDCYGNKIVVSKEGISKKKDYKKAYHEAIRNAFESIKALNYSYVPMKIVQKNQNTNSLVVFNKKPKELPKVNKTIENKLYAQVQENGFRLTDSSSKLHFQLLKTSIKNVFVLKNKKGIFYIKEAVWVAEYYEKGRFIQKEYQVAF